MLRNQKNNLIDNLFAFLISAIGTIFIIYYIFRASTNVVASDYIRIVNYYLKDVTDLHYLLSWEGISRIPFTFLARFINVKIFHYSVFFDKILGAFGLGIFNFVVLKSLHNTIRVRVIKIASSIVVSLISFSLMSWEMILNGTGYSHFLSIGLFALIFYLFDRIVKRTKTIMTLENLDSSDLKYYGNENENNRLSNMVALIDTSQVQRKNLRAHFLVYILTAATTLLFGGSYSVAFLCTIILFSIIEIIAFFVIRNKYNKGEIEAFNTDKELYASFKEQYNNQEIRNFGTFKGEKYSTVNNESTFKIFFKFLILAVISIICLACFLKSNSTGEALVPVGMKDITLAELLATDPKFVIRFFLKSLASSIIGVETFSYALNFGTIDENMIFFIGCIYVLILIYGFIVVLIKYIYKDNSKRNIFDLNQYNNLFPILFIVYGLANYLLVFLARYGFVKDDYGMSSRYAIQYMFLSVGVIMIFVNFLDEIIHEKRYYKEEKKKPNLSKRYLKRKEQLIAEGKIKADEPNISIFNIIISLLCVVCVSVILIGNITTTIDEIFKADYRKVVYQNLEAIARNYEAYNDSDLENAFEYRRGPEQIRDALLTLKTQNLNVFYDKNIKATSEINIHANEMINEMIKNAENINSETKEN